MAKPKKDIKLAGQLFMSPDGDVYMLYGGWHKTKIGNIKEKAPKMYNQIIDTYGTKEGASIRRRSAIVIVRSLSFGKPGGD